MDEPIMRSCPACEREYPEARGRCPICGTWCPNSEEIRAGQLRIQESWPQGVERERCAVKPVPATTRRAELIVLRDDD